MWNGLEKRISRLEKSAEQVAKARSKSSPDCICFPATEQPFFVFPIEGDIAFFVKCPLHGDRFRWPRFYSYVAKWCREKEPLRRQRLSAQYQKAWAASFPSDPWPAEEEDAEEGTYLRLKDGTRLLAHEFAWKKKKAPGSLTPTSGSTESARTMRRNESAPGLEGTL